MSLLPLIFGHFYFARSVLEILVGFVNLLSFVQVIEFRLPFDVGIGCVVRQVVVLCITGEFEL